MTMNAHALTLVAFGLLLAPRSAPLAQDSPKQERAIAEIEKAKGWVGVDAKRAGKRVIRVGFDGAPPPSAKWPLWIQAFPQLEELSAC
jgi:hypothetical protein